ncbi:MAG: hypothetical protein F6K25_26895 [Okeania sp. SIO2G4]|nr:MULTISPECIES: hypothetical protein [unclassified Okeania]NEP05287.1 hypothetical protein [Okeania sp. SIO4D6]NEP42325.1 hypothetical protein [Okeania sp. SIO2H7]NEP75212.1 hypothetical protein [Okeania sp. SIO2G5]NEP96293.1 hypothetical protein [Okeania sp. SIO2F5]NEQ94082.1 hypothetical protein [Okeania sp. SIO2G4]
MQKNNSQLLPNLDLDLLVSYLDWEEPLDAIWDFKKRRKKEEERRKK